jgi:hypothetical protein
LVLAGLLLLTVLTRLPTLNNLLIEAHPFRQTQTAWASLLFAQQGIDLLRPQVPVFGPPFALPLEFPLFQAAASLLIRAGLGPDPADRSTALLCFLFALAAVYRLGVRLSGRVTARIAAVAFAFSPFALLWSRASLIEFMAVAFSLWYLELGLAALEAVGRRRAVLLGVAAALGAAALTVKGTTGIFWLLPLGLVLLARWPRPVRVWRPLLNGFFLFGLPVAGGLVWLIASAAVRRQNIFVYAFNDQVMISWFFGNLAQRLDPNTWGVIGLRLLVETSAGLLPLFAVLAWREIRTSVLEPGVRAAWAGIASLIVLAPLVLTNVYFVHDYYLCAILPAVALLIGLAGAFLYRRRDEAWARTLILVSLACWVLTLTAGFLVDLVTVTTAIAGGYTLAWWVYRRIRPGRSRFLWGLVPAIFVTGLLFGASDQLFFLGPIIVALVWLGLGLTWWRRNRRPPPERRPTSRVLLVGLGLACILSLVGQLRYLPYVGNYVSLAYDVNINDHIIDEAAAIAALVPPDRLVALLVPIDDWDPAYFYYAHREGLMIGAKVRSLGGLDQACSDPRYVLLRLSVDHTVTRAACPDGEPVP